jgi:hypothetical protein
MATAADRRGVEEHSETALELLRLTLKDALDYLRHAGVYGRHEQPANNVRSTMSPSCPSNG